jgi:NAD(P) transhydrogenase subunit alpha
LILKENVIVLDWSDEVLAKTVLTYQGRHRRDATKESAFPISPEAKAA